MNRSIESIVRFVNLTSAGLLAGSLGFGDVALVPGWEDERPRSPEPQEEPRPSRLFNAIGPIALASAVTLAMAGGRRPRAKKTLDIASTIGLAGVLGATILVTVPLNRRISESAPLDYPSSDSTSLARNWSRAHAFRTALGIGAFVCAAAANILRGHDR